MEERDLKFSKLNKKLTSLVQSFSLSWDQAEQHTARGKLVKTTKKMTSVIGSKGP